MEVSEPHGKISGKHYLLLIVRNNLTLKKYRVLMKCLRSRFILVLFLNQISKNFHFNKETQVISSETNYKTGVSSFYIFILPFFWLFVKKVLYEILFNLCHTRNHRKNHKTSERIINFNCINFTRKKSTLITSVSAYIYAYIFYIISE